MNKKRTNLSIHFNIKYKIYKINCASRSNSYKSRLTGTIFIHTSSSFPVFVSLKNLLLTGRRAGRKNEQHSNKRNMILRGLTRDSTLSRESSRESDFKPITRAIRETFVRCFQLLLLLFFIYLVLFCCNITNSSSSFGDSISSRRRGCCRQHRSHKQQW